MNPYDDQILGHLGRDDYRPQTVRALARKLGVGTDQYASFRQAARTLLGQGTIELGRGKTLVKPGAAESAMRGAILGTFRRTSKGFGFVRPQKAKEAGAGKAMDIYIPAKAARDASTGDTVAVSIVKRPHTPGLNLEGKVLRVVERASGLFVGSYYEEDGQGYVKVDGTTFHAPLFVGDPGAKGAKPGDKVAIEIARYPTADREGEGVITEVLGARGQPGVDTLTVIRAFNLPDAFDDEVLVEAREQAKLFDESELGGRLDLRDVLTVTIDPATARDFDDAITLSRDDRGYWSLGVHIADVSHFVAAGSELDREARKRGNSVYLPDRVLPMLPEVLSNSLASLQAGHTRFTVSALLEFDPDGVRTDKQFGRSAIRVDHRFSYEQAFEAMSQPDQPIEGLGDGLRGILSRMLELARILRKRRFARGALQLTMPEVEVDLGDQGEVTGAHLAGHDETHEVIEEFMLAANEAVAEMLTGRGAGFLRRTHSDPEPRKLKVFADFVRGLGFKLDLPQSRFELQRVLDEAAERPERHAVHYALLRSLKQAVYSPEHEGHYALASNDYCHFTSPIRRYPDLQVHRQLIALIGGKKPRSDADELVALAEHCTRTERRAEAAERELIKIKLLTHMETRIGEEFQAVIIGVEEFGLFAQLVELPVEGLIHVTNLGDDYYYYESTEHSLIGRRGGTRYRLGDRLSVRVARVDVDRRELDLVPAALAPPPLDLPDLPPDRRRTSTRPPVVTDRPRPKAPPAPRKSKGKKRRP